MQLPRVDVSLGALMGAVSALLTLLLGTLNAGVVVDWWTVLPPLLVVIAVGGVAYFVRASKELWGGVAGALLVIVQFFISARRGEVFDMALVATAVTYFVNLVFLQLLPRIQPSPGLR